MTLIALVNPENPTLLSDVLLSSTGEPAVSVTPTGVSIIPTEYIEASYSPLAFRQKTAILHDGKIAVSVAGNFQIAMQAVCALRDGVRQGEISHSGLEKWCVEANKRYGKDVSLIIAWFEGNQWSIARIGNHMLSKKTRCGSEVYFTGSGSSWLSHSLVSIGENVEQIGDFNDEEKIRLQAIGQTGFHLFNEHYLGIRESFGGGFQITYFQNGKFQHAQNITYILLSVYHNKKGAAYKTELVPVIVQQGYDKRDMVFKTRKFEKIARHEAEDSVEFRGPCKLDQMHIAPLLTGTKAPAAPSCLERTNYFYILRAHFWEGSLIDFGSSVIHSEGDVTCPIKFVDHCDGHASLYIRQNELKSWQREVPFKKKEWKRRHRKWVAMRSGVQQKAARPY